MGLPEQIQKRLFALQPRSFTEGYIREAAVLMPIFVRGHAPHFLLTRRTEEVETHKGQISFPGGMRGNNESPEQTALRETFEEIGIEASRIRILGRFHDYLSSTDYLVSPFIGYIHGPFTLVPQVREVAEVLQVPFQVFRDTNRLRVERVIRHGREIEVYFYSYGRHEIWGLTAKIIRDFLAFLESDRRS